MSNQPQALSLIRVAFGAAAAGALTVAAAAIGALAVGTLILRRSRIDQLSVGSLRVDVLNVAHLTIRNAPNPQSLPDPINSFLPPASLNSPDLPCPQIEALATTTLDTLSHLAPLETITRTPRAASSPILAAILKAKQPTRVRVR